MYLLKEDFNYGYFSEDRYIVVQEVTKDTPKEYKLLTKRVQSIFYNAVSIEDAVNQLLKHYEIYERNKKA